MNKTLKYPDWVKKILIILAISGIILGSLPFFEFKTQEAEANFLNQTEESPQIAELLVIQGNSLLPISDLSLLESAVIRKINVVVTGYSSTPWETDDSPHLTAAGTWVREGIVANNLLPFGTKVRIPEIYGDRVFVVEDRMNSKKGYYHIDIWFSDSWRALNFGAKRTYIEVLES